VLVVACLSGVVVTLPASPTSTTAPVRTSVSGGLRDVVVQSDGVYVSTFREAELVKLAADGTEASRSPLRSIEVAGPAIPHVAWRTLAAAGGQTLMIHQASTTNTIDTQKPGGYGGDDCAPPIVTSHFTVFQGASPATPVRIPDAVLPVDAAVSKAGDVVTIIAAGNNHNPNLLNVVRLPIDAATGPSPPPPPDGDGGVGCAPAFPVAGAHLDGEPVAIALLADDRPVILTREPAALAVQRADGQWDSLGLGGASVADTGHAIFHSNSGAGLACASCHAEASDDGHVWTFDGGAFFPPAPRRTQNFRGGFLATAPFHWDGSQATIGALVHEVFVGRMSGPELSPDEVDALGTWMNALPTLRHEPPSAAAAAASIERGKAVFADTSIGCTGCHSGPMLTNNRTIDVGTGGAFQVPSLLGLSFRAPYLHDGSAATIADRFGAIGGGDQHGKTSALSAGQIADLVAYLGTL
jgi:hypothetical protein